MGTLTGNVWVCAECRSINNERAKQCYNCRTPRDLAAVDPATIEGTGHGKLRDVALPPFESPRPYAVIASIAILATAGVQLILTLYTTALTLRLGGTVANAEQLQFMAILTLVTIGIGLVGLVTWSLWLSRAVASMPALGLGYPAATRLMAFVENFLPGLNLLRVPAIVRDVVRRLESGSTAAASRGQALILTAWIALLGGFVVPRVYGFVNAFAADSREAAEGTRLTIEWIAIGLVLAGALFLVALIWWIDARIARRREAQLAAIDAATAGAPPEAAEPSDDDVVIREPTPAAPRVPVSPPATARWSWGDSAASPLAGTARMSPTTIAGSAAGWDTELLPPLPSEPQASAPPEPLAVAPEAPAPPQEHAPPVAEGPAPVPAPPTLPAAPVVSEASPQAPAESGPTPDVVAPTSPGAEMMLTPEAAAVPQPEPSPTTAAPTNGAPHLTIRIANHGMLQAELAGETEPVILEDLTAYGEALANAGGTAEIVIAGKDGMASLIARRAQRILAEAGIEAPIPT